MRIFKHISQIVCYIVGLAAVLLGGMDLAEAATVRLEPFLVDVIINQERFPEVMTCYYDHNGGVWLQAEQLHTLHLRLPKHVPLVDHQRRYYQLKWYPRTTYRLDQHILVLHIRTAARNFIPTVIQSSVTTSKLERPASPGGFLNYTLVATGNRSRRPDLSALLSGNVFNHYGVGSANFLLYNRLYHANQHSKIVRLDTAWFIDQPEHMTTWRVGDAVTGVIDWSNAVRFGGIQYATNFGTQPTFITFPLPSYRGEAVLPSNVDVFVNSVLNQRRSVRNGPFILNSIPVLTGAGTVSVVTQDIFGRNHVVNIPYYTSPVLLKKGLSNFSYETGWTRNNYGIDSNAYRQLMAAGTYQQGITDRLTLGVHGELLRSQQTVGLTSHYLWHRYGILSFAVAGSRYRSSIGELVSAGFIRQTNRLSFGMNATLNTEPFVMLGIAPKYRESRLLGQFFTGYSAPHFGSLEVNYTVVRNNFLAGLNTSKKPRRSADFFTATYNRTIFSTIAMTIGAVTDFKQADNNQIFASLTVNLDQDRFLNLYTGYQQREALAALTLSKNLPLATGYGYHLTASTQPSNYFSGDLSLQNNVGLYTARVYGVPNNSFYEADIGGGVVYLDRQMFLSRPITNSFAVVSVPRYENIRVYYENQDAGRTNKDGHLLVPQLLPYQNNKIAIELRDFPLYATVPITERMVLPYANSGVLVRFPVNDAHSITARLVTSAGKPVPVGASVTLNGHPAVSYIVGYRGLFYIPHVQVLPAVGTASWEGRDCIFIIHTISAQHNVRTIPCLPAT